jgi:hypothetical protein
MAKKPIKKVVKTTTVTDVINVTREIGDNLATKFENTGDIKVASASLDAYKTAISGSKTQLIYKKLTGKPGTIPFLEE